MDDFLVWIDPDGTEHPLRPTFTVNPRLAGRLGAPIQIDDEVVPFQAGSRVRQVRYQPRNVDVPLTLSAATPTAVIRDWGRRLDPTLGDGRLRSRDRELVCRYIGGLDQTLEEMPGFLRMVWSFRAFDPFWQDAVDTAQTFSTGEDAVLFFPILPMRLVSATATGTPLVVNDGDVETWPVWTVVGPGGPVELRNDTTGETLELTTVLGAGQTLHIDTRPGAKTIVDGDEVNRYPDRVAGSALWPLVRGPNQLAVAMPGADSSSRVTLSYRRRFLSV